MRHSRTVLGLVCLALASSFAAGPGPVQGFRLNAPLAQTWAGRVRAFEIPAGGRVVFELSPSLTAPFELCSAPLDGSQAPVLLSSPGESLDGLRLSPSGTHAVYRDAEEVELFSVPVDGSQAPVRVSHSSPLGLAVLSWLVTPDSSRVVYVAFEGFFQEPKIYSVPLGGGSAIQLSATLPLEDIVLQTFAIGASGNRVVFPVLSTLDAVELFSRPADGSGALVRLCPPLAAGRRVKENFQLAPDGSLAFYVADQDAANVFELYRVPTDGSAAAVKLSGTLVAGGDLALAGGLAISSDGLRAVFVADGNVDGRVEIFSVLTDGSAAPQRLNGPLVAGGNVSSDFRISPDGERVIYLADQDVDGVQELFSAPIDGSAVPVQLNGPLVPGGGVSSFAGAFAVSPDSTRVVYLADQLTDEVVELFSVPIDGSQPAARLNPQMVPAGDVRLAQISADSARVAFLADAAVNEETRLHVVPLVGGAPSVELEVQACVAKDAGDFRFDPTGTRLVFLASGTGTPPPVELRGAPADGSQASVNLAPSQASSQVLGDVQGFVLGAKGHRAVYSADVDDAACGLGLFGVSLDGPYGSVPLSGAETALSLHLTTPEGRVLYTALPAGLYSAPLEGGSPPLLLTPLANQIALKSLRLAPDGVTALFLARVGPAPFELYAARTDEELSAVKLSAPLVAGGGVLDYRIEPAGDFVVYHADQAINEVFELFRVPLDRSHPPWRLNAPLAAGRSIPVSDSTGDSWLISPDGARVVYRADARTNDVFELFSVQLDRRRHVRRVDAPRPLARLSRSLIAGGDVEGFRITPDGTTVVYRADQVVDQRFELYRVPTDGSAPPVRVSSNLGMTGSIESRFEVSTDGTRVLYRADPRVNGRIELWSVPLAGGTAIPLNAPLPSSGDVHDFVIAPGSERAVYLSAVSSIASQELFGVPLDGSQPAVQLSTTPAFRSLIPSFRITPRGDSVVYLSDQIVDERFELFAVPIDGTRSPVPVSGGLASGGDVVAFELTPDGNRVVYRADESADERFELFLAYLTPRYRRR